MVLPCHSVSKAHTPRAKPSKERRTAKAWPGTKEEELEGFDQMMHEKFKWPHTP